MKEKKGNGLLLTVPQQQFNFIIEYDTPKLAYTYDGINNQTNTDWIFSYNPSTHPINVYWSDTTSSYSDLYVNGDLINTQLIDDPWIKIEDSLGQSIYGSPSLGTTVDKLIFDDGRNIGIYKDSEGRLVIDKNGLNPGSKLSSYTSSRIEKYKVLKDENGNAFNANSDVLKSILKDTNFADSNLNNMDPNQIPTGNVHLYFNDSAPSDSLSGIHEYVFAIESGNFVSNKILTQSEFTNLENSEGLDINNDSEIGSPNSLAPQVKSEFCKFTKK